VKNLLPLQKIIFNMRNPRNLYLAYRLWLRKQARKLAAERASRAYWKAVREQHRRDPLWKGQL